MGTHLALPTASTPVVKAAESLNFAQPQDPTTAALLGAASPIIPGIGSLVPGIYAGSKADSFGTGAKQTIRNLLFSAAGGLGGAAAGGALGLAGTALLGHTGHGREALGGLLGIPLMSSLGGLAGASLGGAYAGHTGAENYNDKLEAYREHQRDLKGPVIQINTRGEREDEERPRKVASLLLNSSVAFQSARKAVAHQKSASTAAPVSAAAFLVSPATDFYKEAMFRRMAAGAARGMGNFNRGMRFGARGGHTALQAANKTVNKLGPRSMNLSNRNTRKLQGALQTQHSLSRPGQGFMGAFGRGVGNVAHSPLRKGLMSRPVLTPLAAGLGYGQGYGSGVNRGVAETMHQFEEMPWYQHLAYGLPNFFGHREALGDYALTKAQDNLPLIARLMGVDFTGDVQNQMNNFRQQR